MVFNIFRKRNNQQTQNQSNSILPQKDKTQDQVESAFMLKDFLAYPTLLKWVTIIIVIIAGNIIAIWAAKLGIITPYLQKIIVFYQYLIIFLFMNYLILYVGIKIYRGFTRYIIPIIKASADLPFRLHQKLLE